MPNWCAVMRACCSKTKKKPCSPPRKPWRRIEAALAKQDFQTALTELAAIKPQVDTFFTV